MSTYKHKPNQGFQKGHKVFGGFQSGVKNPATRPEQRKRTSDRMLQRRGEKHWNWQGGISSTCTQRRRRQMKISGGHSVHEWELLKVQYNWVCPRCKKQEPAIKLTRDHIIPLTKGGSNNIENIQPLCGSCNSSKHTKIEKYEL